MIDTLLERNTVKLHIVDREFLYANGWTDTSIEFWHLYQIPGTQLFICKMSISLGEMAQFVLGDATYDCAMPVGEYCYGCVWLYEQGDHFGKPFDVLTAFNEIVQEFIKTL